MSYKRYADSLNEPIEIDIVKEPFPFKQAARKYIEHLQSDSIATFEEFGDDALLLQNVGNLPNQVVIEILFLAKIEKIFIYDPINKYQSAELKSVADKFSPIISATTRDGQKMEINTVGSAYFTLMGGDYNGVYRNRIYLPSIPLSFLDDLEKILKKTE